MTSLYYY